jgi:hypothetical protein
MEAFGKRPLGSRRWKDNIKEVGLEVLTAAAIKSSIFWDIMQCNPLEVNQRFGGTGRLHLHGLRISKQALLATWAHAGFCSAYYSTLKMEATWSSETSADFQRTTRRYVPEDRINIKMYSLGINWQRRWSDSPSALFPVVGFRTSPIKLQIALTNSWILNAVGSSVMWMKPFLLAETASTLRTSWEKKLHTVQEVNLFRALWNISIYGFRFVLLSPCSLPTLRRAPELLNDRVPIVKFTSREYKWFITWSLGQE